MKTYPRIIQPRDPLICGDGRPFGAGLRGRTMEWPPPSLVIGTARTNLIEPDGFDERGGISAMLAERLLAVEQRGPLPAWRDWDEWQLAFPAPFDALPVGATADSASFYPLRPAALPGRCGTDLATKEETRNLVPVFACNSGPGKPPKGLPRFWKKAAFERWLEWAGVEPFRLSSGDGVHAPERDSRVHVSIDPEAQTAIEGALFSTEGLDFGRKERRPDEAGDGGDSLGRELALYSEFLIPEPFGPGRLQGPLPLGGEGRLTNWSESPNLLASFQPDTILKSVISTGRLRLVLLTPAWFEYGWQAGWMRRRRLELPDGDGLELELRAAAVPRAAPISGWDLYRREPKPTRFLAPSGSVYFFQLRTPAREEQLRKLWLSSVSEEPESKRSLRRDGFGLAAFGCWNPHPQIG